MPDKVYFFVIKRNPYRFDSISGPYLAESFDEVDFIIECFAQTHDIRDNHNKIALNIMVCEDNCKVRDVVYIVESNNNQPFRTFYESTTTVK